MSHQPSDQPNPALDPKRLLEMAMEGMTETTRPRTPPPTSAELEAALPQFDISGLIGQGGMGAVYKAREKKLDRFVALKILRRETVQDPEFEERFVREARAQALLSHPNILAIYDFGETEDFFYIVSEYIDGVDLRQLMNMDRLSPMEALRLVPQICDALQFAHDRGVVHRDIKPENILIDQDGNVRIADFGLAKMLGGHDVTLTRTEQALGTPHYMAPEQMMGAGKVDHRADIYALGVVIYEMLTGELPIGHFAMPSQKVGTRKELDDVVMRALAQAVEDRYQSAGEIKSDVEGVPSDAAPSQVAYGEARLCRRPLVGLILLFVGFVALMGGAALLWDTQVEHQYRHQLQVEKYAAAMREIQVFQESTGKAWTGDLPVKRYPPSEDPTIDALSIWAFIGAAAVFLLLTVMILGFSGITTIKHSAGRLYGLGLAVFVAWILPLAILNAAVFAPLGLIRDQDLLAVVAVIVILTVIVLDLLFLRWQCGRHRAEMA
jgi:tRNA A-37 threonylcarbamoyl transferase component Bud32